METPFLNKDYTLPKTQGNYMKLEKGENLFRVLSPAITGFLYWSKETKPVRMREYPEQMPEDIKVNEDNTISKIKHFWAFKVWNYNAEKIQILELTQVTVQEAIKGYHEDEDFGDPRQYDIKVVREGEKLQTKYTVVAKPPKDLDQKIKEASENVRVNLEELYEGKDPFGGMVDTPEQTAEIKESDIPF